MLTGIRWDATFSAERDLPCSSLEYIFTRYYRILAIEFKGILCVQSKEAKIEMSQRAQRTWSINVIQCVTTGAQLAAQLRRLYSIEISLKC